MKYIVSTCKKVHMMFSMHHFNVDTALIALITVTASITTVVTTGVWIAIVMSSQRGEVIPSTEWRIVLATSIAAVVSIVSTIVNLRNQVRSMRLEMLRKSLEINTEAAFDMWKSCTSAYRLLAKADDDQFEKADLEKISATFEASEQRTLLLKDETLRKYQILWQEAERIGLKLKQSSGGGRSQSDIWGSEIDNFTANYEEMRELLRQALVGQTP
jgi:hypothetical protein